ncbi:hypothetical protein [Nannocystis pusilla]|uniref:Uncharacterized protein n=1 Tax=Nannocystis pusilla TaxID=889268 RepID=A0ABS7TMF5_9BACT|nr:hypothetical protein [Nannocystis pusilla]MBZ5709414.1 hypothetical protein [Nannocystis pusilla]
MAQYAAVYADRLALQAILECCVGPGNGYAPVGEEQEQGFESLRVRYERLFGPLQSV